MAILVDFAGQNKQKLRNRGFFYPVRRELGIQTLDPYPNGHDRELRQLHLLMAVAEQALHPDALSESSLYCEKATLDERMFGTGKRLLTDEIVEEYINLLRVYQEKGLVEGGYYPYA